MTKAEWFSQLGEPFAAGLFEFPEASPMVRYANALKRYWQEAELPGYDGGRLYPCGVSSYMYDTSICVRPHYANTLQINRGGLRKKDPQALSLALEEYNRVIGFADSPHTVGGMGWTHSFPNYARVLSEGLEQYRERILALPEGDFREAMLTVMEAVDIYHNRCLQILRRDGAPEALIGMLERVPYQPARSLEEALLCVNFIFYLDGCDDIGPLDRLLKPYYKGEDLVPLLREFFRHADENDGWSGTLGPDYNEITRACLQAIHNGRRPNLQLLVREDMPEWVWQESAASLATSCGQPALYNWQLYRDSMRQRIPELPEADLSRLAFGGCTETMLEGISAVGSDDAGINIALIFSDYMRSSLESKESFADFFDGLVEAIRREVAQTLDRLNLYRKTRALYRPDVIRTLLVDDCIDRQTEFHAGGARWVWSCVNMAGVINVIDSLNVIRTLLYEEKRYTPLEFLEKLDQREPEFLARARRCPSFGNNDSRADAVGAELVKQIDAAFGQRSCYPRGAFFPVSNQFTTYAQAGAKIPATPDGRGAGEPLCDSLGAVHGKDKKGPTALLNSVAALPLHRVLGTPITNIRISKAHIHATLKPLTQGFFREGGMQLQVSCLSRAEMLDAMEHPEKYSSLVVRVGGYSEYFTRLTPQLQKTVLERTEY